MKKSILLSVLVSFVFIGCGGGSSTEYISGEIDNTEITNTGTDTNETNNTEVPTIGSQELIDTITYMYHEEGLAYDLYMNINKVQPVKQLLNIATNSEIKHISQVNELAKKYDLNVTKYPDTDNPYSLDDIESLTSGIYPVEHIQELYNLLYDKGINSKQDALEVGCMVEVTDIDDLNAYIEIATTALEQDIISTFESLRSGSYNHYWTFDAALKTLGIVDGCCSLGTEYCHPEYPQK